MTIGQQVFESPYEMNPAAEASTCSCKGHGSCDCSTATQITQVYAVGRILPRCPNLSVEKELQQAIGRDENPNSTDVGLLHKVLAEPRNRYLARSMCWVFSIEGIDTYIVQPAELQDLNLLIEATRARPRSTDIDVVLGYRGSIAPASMCNGLSVPIIYARQIYSFDVDALLQAIPKPKKPLQESFLASAEELFDRLMLMADNAGATDENRAMNYLAVRYHAIYDKTAAMHEAGYSLASIEAFVSGITGARKIIDVHFVYRNRLSDVEDRYLTSVDVTGLFPFLIRKLSPTYQRN